MLKITYTYTRLCVRGGMYEREREQKKFDENIVSNSKNKRLFFLSITISAEQHYIICFMQMDLIHEQKEN